MCPEKLSKVTQNIGVVLAIKWPCTTKKELSGTDFMDVINFGIKNERSGSAVLLTSS